MADVTLSYVPTLGSTVSPAGINANFYQPTVNASSYAELNGRMEKENFDTAAYTIRSGLIRDRSMGNGRMVGSTMNQDILALLSPTSNTDAGALKPIAGAAITFYVPKAPSMFWATWQVCTSSDIDLALAGLTVAELQFRVDGTPQGAQKRSIIPGCTPLGTHRPSHDQVWSGHWAAPNASPISAGWHTCAVCYWGSNAGTSITSGVRSMTRFRVRNIKVFWLV
jgi:hypothetical protein